MNSTNFAPSAMDLLLTVPRLAQRAGAFAFYYVPEQLDFLVDKVWSGSVIAAPTQTNNTVVNATSSFAQGASSSALPNIKLTAQTLGDESGMFSLKSIRDMGGLMSYVCTKWSWMTVLVAFILNRTQVYATQRTPLVFRWYMALALYLGPIVALMYRVQELLQTIKCQTSPNWSELRYGSGDVQNSLDAAGGGGYAYYVSSALLFYQDNETACRAVNMIPPPGASEIRGSLSILWPVFLTFCLNHLVDTFACALQGTAPKQETGMTIFEHSLTYSDCESMILRPLDLGLAEAAKLAKEKGTTFNLTRAMLMRRINAPVEVLLLSLISCFSHLSSSILAVTGKRSQLRLVTTSIWGICYLAVSAQIFLGSELFVSGSGIFRIPIVCLIGSAPYLVVIVGLFICAMVYGLGLLMTVMSPPPGRNPRTFRERLAIAYNNSQVNVQLSSHTPVTVNWHDDFFSALLKVGGSVLGAASEAVYLNEGTKVRVADMTWLEEKRMEELAKSRGLLFQRIMDSIPFEARQGWVAEGVASVDVLSGSPAAGASPTVISGYAKERKSTKGNKNDRPQDRRSGRLAPSLRFLRGTVILAMATSVMVFVKFMRFLGFRKRPRWLVRLIGREEKSRSSSRRQREPQRGTLQYWMVDDRGELTLPIDRNVDVEAETRKRLGLQMKDTRDLEDKLGENLYGWWKLGGWWGDLDTSGDYAPASNDDDDTTSVISMATSVEDGDAWSDIDDEDGRRTPTQRSPFPWSREETPVPDDLLDPSSLADLLDPQTPAAQLEAQMLSRRLRQQGIMTRSRYQRDVDHEKSLIITSSRSFSDAAFPFANNEEQALEAYIISRRAQKQRRQPDSSDSWQAGAEGMGSAGPQCVVCQLSPRTILVWPCGCLSLCDDCRIGLATRNFSACVCCRTNVAAYSRLYVP